ncbi:sin3 histone deacetylase corepressor complex component SDS3 [Pundamilia nyererei]|uniref:Sin3 histone deacetylase corepressor complex component SDS3 n=1 Tax=Pundamilia nyererei TaxID=303518 RepID=A0A9Y3RTB6_9CICH|nr:PREDICTED: sin3 histone deacetylase corepressor complex component SDS3 [Pundamilia nyererei]
MTSTLLSPMVDYYNDEEELDSVDDDDDRSFRGRDSEEDTEDASETDLAKHDEDDYVEIKEQMYQDKLASLKRQLQQLQEGTLQEYQKRMKKLDQQYKERLRNADLFLQLETEQVERNYIKEKKAAVKEFDDKKVELKENLIAELEEKKKMIENEKLTMELTGDSMEVKPIMTRKLRRRPNDPVPIPDKRRKPAPAQLNYLLTDEQIMEDLRTLNKLKSPKRPVSPSSPEHVPSAPMESPTQRYEARIEDGKLYYDKRWYHKSQAIYLESKDNTKISCVISTVGTNEMLSSYHLSCCLCYATSPACPPASLTTLDTAELRSASLSTTPLDYHRLSLKARFMPVTNANAPFSSQPAKSPFTLH